MKTFTLRFFLPMNISMVEEIHFFFTFFWIYGNYFLLLLAHLNSVFMHCLYMCVIYTSVLSHFSFHQHNNFFFINIIAHRINRLDFSTLVFFTHAYVACYFSYLFRLFILLSLSLSLYFFSFSFSLQHAHGTKQLSAHILYYERRKLSTHRTKTDLNTACVKEEFQRI